MDHRNHQQDGAETDADPDLGSAHSVEIQGASEEAEMACSVVGILHLVGIQAEERSPEETQLAALELEVGGEVSDRLVSSESKSVLGTYQRFVRAIYIHPAGKGGMPLIMGGGKPCGIGGIPSNSQYSSWVTPLILSFRTLWHRRHP